jgi:hypothetical protein
MNSAHLQQAVAMCIQSALELQHVAVLLRVYELIRKVDREAI